MSFVTVDGFAWYTRRGEKLVITKQLSLYHPVNKMHIFTHKNYWKILQSVVVEQKCYKRTRTVNTHRAKKKEAHEMNLQLILHYYEVDTYKVKWKKKIDI